LIYICIPTHNEQQTVGVVLWKLRQVLTDFPRDYQLLVADDASTDKTPEVLEPYTRVLPLTVIRSDERQGGAASLEMLLREAVRRSEYPRRDVIVTLQADFSEEPDDLVALVKRLEAGADVAVGNKVSTSKEARGRRFARSLARFFMRRQKWPEGVMTPFDGYRAYRLYAVKRAIEDRGTSRLIRHEGWAAHAELLRAVLPHARRVDVIDVDDRADRLQRPRREKPFAAAMQVRVLASGTEPQGLVGVEELDRIALTASRSRERAAITPQSIQAGREAGSRTNGSRTRQPAGTRRDQGRAGSQTNGTGRARSETGEGRPRRDRTKSEGRTRQKGDAARSAQPRSTEAEGRRRQPRPAAAAAEELSPSTDVTVAGAAAPDAASRPRRKRRRRKRAGQGRAAGAAQDQNASQAPDGQDPGAPQAPEGDTQPADQNAAEPVPGPRAARQNVSQQAAAQPNAAPQDTVHPNTAQQEGTAAEGGTAPAESGGSEDTDPTGGKKRRRRGGRRGGRGRRRPRPDEASGESGGESTVDASTSPEDQPVAEPVARAEND
jgi:hypothetical protein